MRRMIFVIVLVLCAGVAAEVPMVINFQGRLTDSTGASVVDATYPVELTIYGSPDGSDVLWTSGAQTVETVDGLFTYALGANVPLPNDLFVDGTRYLGIVVGMDPEISPRTALVSVPYAFHAQKADTAEVALSGASGEYVDEVGDTMTGDLVFDRDSNGIPELILDVSENGQVPYANLELSQDDTVTAALYGQFWGELDFRYGGDGIRRVNLSAHNKGGLLILSDSTGTAAIGLDVTRPNDYAVFLPDSAINSQEILDEAGISHAMNTTGVTLAHNEDMVDIAVTQITTPAPGYIVVLARSNVLFSDATAARTVWAQIDETAGGARTYGEYTCVKTNTTVGTGEYVTPFFTSRVYYKDSAGFYTFRLEAQASILAGNASMYNSRVLAAYIPTSYGEVAGISKSPGNHPEARLTSRSELIDDEGADRQYELDLRYYELRAKEARIKALEAERALSRAKRQRERNESER